MKSNLPVVHIIGPVGTGKTYFINKKFPRIAEIFDIKKIYEWEGFTPEQLYNNKAAYEQFILAMNKHFQLYQDRMNEQDQKFVIAESTGINGALNSILSKYKELRIWIIPDWERIYNSKWPNRPYIHKLNKVLMNKYNSGKVKYNVEYNQITNEMEYWNVSDKYSVFYDLKIL